MYISVKQNGLPVDNISITDIVQSIYRLAFYVLYTEKGWTTISKHSSADKSNKVIAAFKYVKHGCFQPTPYKVLLKVMEIAEIDRSSNIFDFGSGDGFAARIFASSGASVVGYEEDQEISQLAQRIPLFFTEAFAMLAEMYQIEPQVMKTVEMEVANCEKRVKLFHRDVFDQSVDLSQFNYVFIYYPEPRNQFVEAEFLANFGDLLTDKLLGLQPNSTLLMLRQGVRQNIYFDNLALLGQPTELETGTGSIAQIDKQNQFSKKVSKIITLYRYRLKEEINAQSR